jgi:hypothetical protein
MGWYNYVFSSKAPPCEISKKFLRGPKSWKSFQISQGIEAKQYIALAG